jgi:hypothetical protein
MIALSHLSHTKAISNIIVSLQPKQSCTRENTLHYMYRTGSRSACDKRCYELIFNSKDVKK